MIIAIAGLPGAGKTRLAQSLSHRIDADVVSRDKLFASHGSGVAREQGKSMAFGLLLDHVAAHVARSDPRTLIVEGLPFRKTEQVKSLQAAAGGRERVTWLWLACPVDVCKQRIAQHGYHGSGDRDPSLVDVVARGFVPPSNSIVLDGWREPDEVMEQALALLAEAVGLSSGPGG